MKISSLIRTYCQKSFVLCVLLTAVLLAAAPFAQTAYADEANYTLLINQENADDDAFAARHDLTETFTAQAGTMLTQVLDLNALGGKFTGFHLTGTGSDITGYRPDEDITRPAGTYSEKYFPAFGFAHYENGRLVSDALGFVVDGSLKTGYYAGDEFIPVETPAVRADGSSVIAAFFSRDRYAISLRAHNDADPKNPVLSTGDSEIPSLPAEPFIVKQGANLYERLVEDKFAGEILKHFSAHEPSYGDELQWTWWARWKGTNENGDPKFEIDPGNQFVGNRSRNKPLDPKHTGTVDLMEGPAYDLKDGDASTLEMWKTEVAFIGINYTYYENGQYAEPVNEDGTINENVKEEVIRTYHNPQGFVKEIWLDKPENGYVVSAVETVDPETGEIIAVDPAENYDEKKVSELPDGRKLYFYQSGEWYGYNSLTVSKIWIDSYANLSSRRTSFNFLDYLSVLAPNFDLYYVYTDINGDTKEIKYNETPFRLADREYDTGTGGISVYTHICGSGSQSYLCYPTNKYTNDIVSNRQYYIADTKTDYPAVVSISSEIDENNTVTYEFNWLPTNFTIDNVYYSGGTWVVRESEEFRDNYTHSSGTDSTGTQTITNARNINIVAEKSWDDDSNRDGRRETSVLFVLYKNGTEEYVILNSIDDDFDNPEENPDNVWSYTFENLPVYDEDGSEINYRVDEFYVPYGYDIDITPPITDYSKNPPEKRITITNSYEPETTQIPVFKDWKDGENQDGVRPGSVTVTLFQKSDTNPTGSQVMNPADNTKPYILTLAENTADPSKDWRGVFENLYKYDPVGKLITYTVKEVTSSDTNFSKYNKEAGYPKIAPVIEGSQEAGYIITNKYEPETITVKGTKTWAGVPSDVTPPSDFTIILWADGTPIDSKTFPSTGKITEWSFQNLPKKADGVDIEYKITERAIEGYTRDVPDQGIYDPDTDAYTSVSFAITNTYDTDNLSLRVSKIWDDDNDRDGLRPEAITVSLMTNGSVATDSDGNECTAALNSANSWTHLFKVPSHDAEGNSLSYTAQENDFNCKDTDSSCMTGDVITGYVLDKEEGGQNLGYFRFTNKHTPATIDISAEKVWDDAGDQDGIRPGSVTFVVTRTNDNTVVDAVTLSGSQTTAEFKGLYKYCGNSVECKYTVTEPQVPDGYDMTVSNCVNLTSGARCTITNSYTPDKVEIEVTKVWDDAGNQDGIRPTGDITVTLYKGSGTAKKSVAEVTLNSENGWTAKFPEQPVNENGTEIVYSVDESNFTCVRIGANCLTGNPDTGYQQTSNTGSAANGFTITNKHNPEKVTVKGTKTWVNVPTGYTRPDSITLELKADNVAVDHTVGKSPSYAWEFKDLDKYKAGKEGEEITYSVAEFDVTGFTKLVTGPEIKGSDRIFVVTNTYNPNETQVRVNKVWDDDNDRDKLRPATLTITLYSDNGNKTSDPTVVKKADGTNYTLTLSSEDNWSDYFTGLPIRTESGNEITYTVKEEPFSCRDNVNCLGTDADAALTGYRQVSIVKTAAGGYTITNRHTPETIDIPVTKVWSDENNQDGIRPASVVFTLRRTNADGSVSLIDDLTLTDSTRKAEKIEGSFTGLPKYCDGALCKYTVDEPQAPDGYEMSAAGCTNLTGDNTGSCKITNTHTPATIQIPVTKVWNDSDNLDNSRPEDVTVEILADGKSLNPAVTLTLSDNSVPAWYALSAALPKYRDGGTPIVYTIKEYEVEGYTTSVPEASDTPENGYTITNTYAVETQPLKILKTWNYDGAPSNARLTVRDFLSSITVIIDGSKYYFTNVRNITGGYGAVVNGSPVTITAEGTDTDNWTVTINGLPKNKWDAGKETPVDVDYSIAEDPITNFYTEYGEPFDVKDGFTISNKWNVTTRTVTKTWDDAGHTDARGEVTIHLHGADGSVYYHTFTEKADTMFYTFTDLPVYDSQGKEIEYWTHEEEIDDYLDVQDLENDPFTIKNVYSEGKVIVHVSKVWEDEDNRDGKRPDSVTFYLYKQLEGSETKERYGDPLVLDEGALYGTFGPLDSVDEDTGKKINWIVEEGPLENGYTQPADWNPQLAPYSWTFKNVRDIETVKIVMTKTWDDFDNMYDLRGDQPRKLLDRLKIIFGSVEYSLDSLTMTQEGDETTPYRYTASIQGFPLEITASGVTSTSNEWTIEIDGLPKYKNGAVIPYDINENPDTYIFTRTKETSTDENTFRFTGENFLNMQRGILTKIWVDENNKDGKRPTDPMKFLEGLRLYANEDFYHHGAFTLKEHAEGSKVWTYSIAAHPNVLVTVEDNGDNTWTVTVDKLPRIINGATVSWTVTEEMDGYDSDVNRLEITNLQQVDVTVSKTWEDAENQDNKRQETTVHLFSDGTEIDSATVSTADNWTHTFTGLPKYKKNAATGKYEGISYTVTEDKIAGYDDPVISPKSGAYEYEIINSHTPELITVTVTKNWVDRDDADGLRQEVTAKIHLFADATEVDSVEVGKTDGWTHTFRDLPKYQEGTVGGEIHYSVTEDKIEGYTTTIVRGTGSGDPSFTVTNTYTSEPVELTVRKVTEGSNGTFNFYLQLDGTDVPEPTINGRAMTRVPDTTNIWRFSITTAGNSGSVILSLPRGFDYEVWEVDASGDRVSVDGSPKEDWTLKSATYTSGTTSSAALTPAVFTNVFQGTEVRVKKVWVDQDNHDGIRPDWVLVNLVDENNKHYNSHVLNAANGWEYEFTNLEEYDADGAKINYTVTEEKTDVLTGTDGPWTYAIEISGNAADGYTITNTHTPETIEITGKKVWVTKDDDNPPSSITVRLYADGTELTGRRRVITAQTAEVDGEPWTWKWRGLPEYEGRHKISYTISEDQVENYPREIEKDGNSFVVTNTYDPDSITIRVLKQWDDNNDQDGIRPDSVTVKLVSDTKEYTAELNEQNEWRTRFTVPKADSAGKKIHYTVEEVFDNVVLTEFFDNSGSYALKGITGDEEIGYTITNVHTPEKVRIHGTKAWEVEDNIELPENVILELKANGVTKDIAVAEAPDYVWEFDEQPRFENGVEINYVVTEYVVPGYDTISSAYISENEHEYELVNVYKPNTTFLNVSKIWSDNNNQDGLQPRTVTVQLTADGTPVENTYVVLKEPTWTGIFRNLDIYQSDGVTPISYGVQEVSEIDGYSSSVSGSMDEGYTITNIHIPETMTVEGFKTWRDNDNVAGMRPDSIEITLNKNGSKYEADGVVNPITVGEADNWSWKWDNLPRFEGGTDIKWSVTEKAVDNYETSYSGYNVINTYDEGTTSISVTKTWNDSNNQDGKRPSFINVELFADGVSTGKTIVLGESNNFTNSFIGLPIYKEGQVGQRISYTVKETSAISGYTIGEATGDAAKGFTITNSYTPEKVSVSGSKTWVDNNNAAGQRPASITIRLRKNGEIYATKTVHVTADDPGHWEWNGLPKYENGQPIHWTITEDDIPNYSKHVNGYDVTNIYSFGRTVVTVVKDWQDHNDQDGIRPASVRVHLYANGSDTGKSGVLTAPDWTYRFEDLDNAFHYTVVEDVPAGYSVQYDGDASNGITVINTHVPEVVKVVVTKTWDDAGNELNRPQSVNFYLQADGEMIQHAQFSAAETAEPGWKWEVGNLPKNKDHGVEIHYTIIENAYEDYSRSVSRTVTPAAGSDPEQLNLAVTNKWTPDKTTIMVEKEWIDDDDRDGIRPASVTVKVLGNGKVIDGGIGTLSEENNWILRFEVDEYDDNRNPIMYSVVEEFDDVLTELTDGPGTYRLLEIREVPGGFEIENGHTPETIDINGSKTWNDNDNLLNQRPASIMIKLLADNEQVDSRVVTEQEDWRWSFTGMPKFNKGVEITYTIEEDAVENYTTSINGFDVVNTNKPGYTSLNVLKVWDDNHDAYDQRPESVSVRLLANGVEKGTIVLSERNQWSYLFSDLPIADTDGKIVYTVEETDVPEGYQSDVIGDMVDGYVITNKYVPEPPDVITIPVTKQWSGVGEKPASVTIHLLADGRDTGRTLVLTAADGWFGRFVNLPVHDPATGAEISYSVNESPVPEGYDCTVNGSAAVGFTVTNTKKGEPPAPPFLPIFGELPKTGLTGAAGSALSDKPASVNYLPSGLDLAIPGLGINSRIVTIEPVDGVYPVEWLGDQSGLLAGMALPGEGISVIAAHNTLDAENYGPFALISTLENGDRFFVRDDDGGLMIFQVYANEKIGSHDAEALYRAASRYENTLTLLTCEDEMPEGGYASRRIVSARMISGN